MLSLGAQKGYITLISVLIVSAIGFSLALTFLSLSMAGSDLWQVNEKSAKAKALANTCAEKALYEIRKDTNFAGNGALVIGEGSCTYSVLKVVNEERDISIIGTVGETERKIKIYITKINPVIEVSSWQEVADF